MFSPFSPFSLSSPLPAVHLRRTSLIGLGSALVLVAMLAGCGDDPDPVSEPLPSASSSSSPSASASESGNDEPAASGELPTVDGEYGQPPTITVPDGAPPSDLVVKTLSQGSGPSVEAGETIVVDYAGVRWEDGQTFDSSFDRGSPVGFGIGVGASIPGWDTGLVGVKAGTRVLMVLPPDEAYGDTSPGEPIQAGDTLVFVVDVLGSHAGNEAAGGEPAPTEDDSLPYVSITPKEPQIVPPAGDPSSRLIVMPVVVGDGPGVKNGDTVVVQYKGVLWRNGEEFDSSWSRKEPFVTTIGQGAVIPAWDKGLVGQTVGSRVMLVFPPKDGYGEAGSGQIKGTDTMIFAVDILGTY
ncbi:MAG: FKBP-type peptidyl-prolyl cis-trans isomerase [Actinomycetia bacterium]|nr:FKBP-type peptidyl-prolyl cis-trans isomerase [Actinomycetes bacterium]